MPGIPGIKGLKGNPGRDGLPGPTGLSGPRGEMGLDGIAGREVCNTVERCVFGHCEETMQRENFVCCSKVFPLQARCGPEGG